MRFTTWIKRPLTWLWLMLKRPWAATLSLMVAFAAWLWPIFKWLWGFIAAVLASAIAGLFSGLFRSEIISLVQQLWMPIAIGLDLLLLLTGEAWIASRSRPKIAPDWREWVKETAANDRSLSAAALERLADKEIVNKESPFYEREDSPSPRSIGRIITEMSEQERQLYVYVRWPESFGSNDLPWEAVPEVLDQLRIQQGAQLGRLTVRQARWYWRIARSAPNFHKKDNHMHTRMLSITLAALEVASVDNGREFWSILEFYFAYAPWQSKRAAAAYLRDSVGGGDAEPFTVITDTQLNWDSATEGDVRAETQWHPFRGRRRPRLLGVDILPGADWIKELQRAWEGRDIREAANAYIREHPNG